MKLGTLPKTHSLCAANLEETESFGWRQWRLRGSEGHVRKSSLRQKKRKTSQGAQSNRHVANTMSLHHGDDVLKTSRNVRTLTRACLRTSRAPARLLANERSSSIANVQNELVKIHDDNLGKQVRTGCGFLTKKASWKRSNVAVEMVTKQETHKLLMIEPGTRGDARSANVQ